MANYQITGADDLADGGAKTKARKNIAAIRLLKEVEQEQRSATSEERAILIRYTGWGVAADIFTTKPEWAALREELEDALTEEEFAAARASTLNAFYTDVDITTEIYKGIERLGFAGGTILDPSMGATGIFEGAMPPDMASQSQISGIELDSISGRIASQLYPESTVYVQGFQDVILPDDHFDLTISNVPFSEVGVKDPRYKGQPVNTLHDYFFAKGLDKVRPGGLVAYITSTGTMQSAKGEPFRQYMSDRANLVGAMRLPGDAFKKNAGTEVTTDLIILQKLGNGVEPNGIEWTALKETDVLDSEGNQLRTNQYYAQRPELMLGELCDDKLYPGRLALKGDGRDISQAIRQAFEAMPEAIYQPELKLETKAETERILVPPELQSKVKQDGFVLHEERLMVRAGDYLQPSDLEGKPYERAIGLMAVRDAVQEVFDVQLREGTDSELGAAQSKLSKIYDGFVKANGYISSAGNRRTFRKDPDLPLLLALEKYDPEEKTAQKTDIFSKRTIRAHRPRTEAENAKEGLLFSLNEYGKVDIDHIAKLTSQSKLETVLELQREQLIFRDPVAQEWQTQDEYLSGNVKQKLEIAQVAATTDNQFATNVEALEAVQPEPLLPGDIDVRLGSVWVPAADVKVFTQDLLGVDEGITVRHSPDANKWYVTTQGSLGLLKTNSDIYGTGDVKATTLIELALNLKNPTIYRPDPNDADRRIVDQDATAAARLKQEEIKEKFKDWIWQDPERTERLTDRYNETFNTNRERQYDGSHLELPGKNPNFVLRKHQADAVYRSLSGNMLLAHVVGAGKTAEMICSAMEQKRLGLANKPIFVVPNHLLEQWAGEIKHLYPTANILAATKKDSSAANRQQLMSRIATGQWDAVVVTHTAFEKLQLSGSAQTQFLKEEYEKVKAAILSLSKGGEESRRTVKDLERKKLSLKGKIEEVANSSSKDNTLTFEQLGVDLLVVDESHYFKNLGYVTKMRNIAGLPNTESKRAFDMHMKVRYMAQVRGEGKGVIFATGTPIANSMAELYTTQRYLQPKELERMGLASFDDWASVFGETVTSAELAATGKFQVKTRFSSFVNMPELMSSVRQVMDIQTADMLKLPVPELLGGKPTVVAVPATDGQLAYMDELVERAENMRNVEPWEDNMLKLTGNGRSASADMRLLFPDEPDDPDSKINRFVGDAFDFWEEHGQKKTHLVFCDLGTPKKAGEFSLYQDIKDKLMAKGLPAKAIAFAQDYKTDAKKLQLQQNFNKGKIAILISGAQLETGFNGQRKLARISHLTVPWRPDQIEQRDGRMIRQGNENSVVESRRYVTQGRNGQPGIDGYFWQTLETKAGFISQVMKGSTDVRRMADVSSEALNYSEIKAIATGNPLIMEKATLDNSIRQLSAQKRAHTNTSYRIRQELNRLPDKIGRLAEAIEVTSIDISTAKKAQESGEITLFRQTLSLHEEDEIGKRIRSAAAALTEKEGKSNQRIGSFGEFNLYIQSGGDGFTSLTYLRIEGKDKYYRSKILGSKASAYRPLKELKTDLEKTLGDLTSQLADQKKNFKDLSQQADKPFSKEDELAAATKRLAEVHEGLKVEVKNPGQGRIAAPEQQETSAGSGIAQLVATLGLERSIVSPEGFYLSLQSAEGKSDLVIDSDDGKRISFKTDVEDENLQAKDFTVVFQVDEAGLLTLESAQADGLPDISKTLLAERFTQYVASHSYVHSVTAEPVVVEEEVEPHNAIASVEKEIEPHNEIASPEKEVVEEAALFTTPEKKPQVEEEVVLRIRSIYSGVEDEVTLPGSNRTGDLISSTQGKEESSSHIEPAIPANKTKEPVSTGARDTGVVTSERSLDSDSNVASFSQHLVAKELIKVAPPSKETTDKALKLQLEADIKEAQQEAENGSSVYSGEHITITRNPQQKGIEVRFTDKPSKQWTQELKALKFRFSKKGSDARWYRKESQVSMPLLMIVAKRYEQAMAISAQPSKEPEAIASIKEPGQHQQRAERNAAKLIHTAELATKVMTGETFHLRVENGTLNDLVIESHQVGDGERLLYLSQYAKDAEERTLDCEAVFVISKDGELRLEETATRNLVDSGEIRQRHGGDRPFAGLITRNLINYEYAECVLNPETPTVEKDAEPATLADRHKATKIAEPALAPDKAESERIAPKAIESRPIGKSYEQSGAPEQTAAEFIHTAGLAAKLVQQDSFHLKVDNGVFNPLVIESNLQADGARQVRLSLSTGKNAQPSGLVAETVFAVDRVGKLSLKETATLNPIIAKLVRSQTGDPSVAGMMMKTIVSQKYAEHIRQPSTSTKKVETSLSQPLNTAKQLDLYALSNQLKTLSQPPSASNSQAATAVAVEAKSPLPSTAKLAEKASSIFKGDVQKKDLKLQSALTSQKPTTSVAIEQLRDWYVAIQYQQKQPDATQLKAVRDKGIEAASTGSAELTPTEVQTMDSDIKRFTSAHPETTVDSLRTWYRANQAGKADYITNIQKIAQQAKAATHQAVQLRPTDQARMEREVPAFNTKVAQILKPGLQSIWAIANKNQLACTDSVGNQSFSGKTYAIQTDKENGLTLIHKDSDQKISFSASGEVLHNSFSLQQAQSFQATAQKMIEIADRSPPQPQQMQA